MSEKMDETSRSLQTAMQEYYKRFEKSTMECSETIHDHGRALQKSRNENEVNSAEVVARVVLAEERMGTLEGRMIESQQRHNEGLDRLSQRAEKLANALELVRLDAGTQMHNLEVLSDRISEIQDSVAPIEEELMKVIERERKVREDQLTSMREAIVSEHERVLASLEGKLTQRLAQESAARQEGFSSLVDNVHQTIRNAHKFKTVGGDSKDVTQNAPPMLTNAPEGQNPQQPPSRESTGQSLPRPQETLLQNGPSSNVQMMPQSIPPQAMGNSVSPAQMPQTAPRPPQNMPPQGVQPQGMRPQGVATQAMPPQGKAPQGKAPQGKALQGKAPQTMPPQGMPPQGKAPQGKAPQSMPPQGIPPQGRPSQGMPPQGARPKSIPP